MLCLFSLYMMTDEASEAGEGRGEGEAEEAPRCLSAHVGRTHRNRRANALAAGTANLHAWNIDGVFLIAFVCWYFHLYLLCMYINILILSNMFYVF